ncbi:hypothetical protein [Prevotella sp. BV3P1]|uniref:hypothetical protein n=1 Tax=Prevotella sp. BV3P1 TaxID=1111130 RepID=UPI0012DC5F7D|nr:hypothetical protein [Prevotella sp. BV3P1]
MSKTETRAAVKKAAYISPRIVCFSVEYSLCAASPIGGGHKKAEFDSDLLEDEDANVLLIH